MKEVFEWLLPPRSNATNSKFISLRSDLILTTITKLESRIAERFPESGLYKVCAEFNMLARQSETLVRQMSQPIWIVRIIAFGAAFLLLGLSIWVMFQMFSTFRWGGDNVHDFLQSSEAVINELIFLALALYFLVNLEQRLKRRVALNALHRLRSIAHVVDMHQLTKDPAFVLTPMKNTESSPERTLTKPLLTRYLDYCSEILALIAKIAALYAQNTDDGVVLASVNDLESLTQGLSSKIWQKIMILDLADA